MTRKMAVILTTFAAITAIQWGVNSPASADDDTPPPHSLSFYMYSVNQSHLYSMGCSLGTRVEGMPGQQHFWVVLDYGYVFVDNGVWKQHTYGATPNTLGQILQAVQEYAHGFFNCSGTDISSVLYLGWGTNTSGGAIGHAAGVNFGNRVKDLANYSAYLPGSQVVGLGANDIEGFPGNGASAADIRDWAQGFSDGAPGVAYLNFGDAAGCPDDHTPNATDCGTAAHPDYNANDILYWSWTNISAFPLPEIYTPSGSMARQWKFLSLRALSRGYSPLDFRAVMSQQGACNQANGCPGTDNTADEAWSQLDHALDNSPSVDDNKFGATDIRSD